MKIGRRGFLRGLGATSISIALPPLEILGGRRDALGATAGEARRLVFFLFPNGAMPEDWTPLQTGTDWISTEVLQPLEAHRSRINVVTGLSNRDNAVVVSNGNPHAITFSTFMTGVPMSPQGGGGGVSVDQFAADIWRDQTPFSSLVLGISKRNSLDEGRFSYTAPHTPVDIRTDPRQVFDALFGTADPSSAASARATRRRSVLDFITDDVNTLKSELGRADNRRLDEHLNSIRELERRLDTDFSQCTVPGQPDELEDADDTLDLRAEALMDLGVMALWCNLTRVLVVSLGSTGNQHRYPFLNISEPDHEISHFMVPEGVDGPQLYRDVVRWKVSKFASLLGRLDSAQVGDGTLLDCCLTACLSEMSTGPGHFTDMLPVVVAGGGIQGGRHLVYPCGAPLVPRDYRELCSSDTPTPLANLWLTMLRGAGIDVESFGNSTSTLTGLWT